MRDGLIKDLEELKSPEGYLYAGIPKFKGLFGRDSLIAAWQLLEYDSTIARNTLLALAKVQGKDVIKKTGEQPGKIPHEYYSGNISDEWFDTYKKDVLWLKKEQAVYFSVDSTILFVVVAAKYYEETQDKEFLKEIWPNIKRAVNWMFEYGLNDGLMMFKKLNPEDGLDSQSWKDGIGKAINQLEGELAIVEVQGYAYLAMLEVAKLALVMKDDQMAEQLELSAEILRSLFMEKFWDEEKGYFVFGLDNNGQKIRSVMSNAGHLLFTGIIDRDKADIIIKRLFAPDMWTKYGIRTHSTLEPEFNPRAYQLGTIWPHDNWIIAQGLKKLGYNDEYERVTQAMILAYDELDCIPELYAVTEDDRITMSELEDEPCYPQAWSTAATINVLM